MNFLIKKDILKIYKIIINEKLDQIVFSIYLSLFYISIIKISHEKIKKMNIKIFIIKFIFIQFHLEIFIFIQFDYNFKKNNFNIFITSIHKFISINNIYISYLYSIISLNITYILYINSSN